MAIEASQPLKIGHLLAGADLSASQYLLVKLNASGAVVLCTASTDLPIGVLVNKPVANQPCELVVIGVTKVVAGAAISANTVIMPNASSQAIAWTATNTKSGKTLAKAAGGANELVEVFVNFAPNLVAG